MPFDSDKQRKAFFARKGNPRSDTSPVMIQQSKFQKLKGFIAKEKELLRQKRESKGLARIEREKIALEKERITAKRLKAELEVEQARETVAMQRRETQAEFSKIGKERRARRLAPFIIAGKRVRTGVRATIKAGKTVQKFERRITKTRKKKRKSEETLAFGIE